MINEAGPVQVSSQGKAVVRHLNQKPSLSCCLLPATVVVLLILRGFFSRGYFPTIQVGGGAVEKPSPE